MDPSFIGLAINSAKGIAQGGATMGQNFFGRQDEVAYQPYDGTNTLDLRDVRSRQNEANSTNLDVMSLIGGIVPGLTGGGGGGSEFIRQARAKNQMRDAIRNASSYNTSVNGRRSYLQDQYGSISDQMKNVTKNLYNF